ncbi:MAG: fluoride efflux transporter CrcB [Bacteroidota bacterium]|jgi:CrcB protein
MNWFWVAIGGAVGSVLRFLMARLLPLSASGFPTATLLVNLSGCLLIGMLAVVLPQGWPRLLLVTGVLGGFTTYSGFGLETQQLLAQGRTSTAFLYLGATWIGGLICTAAGWKAAQFMNA